VKDVELAPGERVLRINPGAGFGTGTHETTQLCLEAIAKAPRAARALDFGSGSGILSIALALLGSEVDSVEIDPLAIDNARENAGLNGVAGKIRLEERLDPAPGSYGVVVANILKPVLLEFADPLVSRLAPSGALILSGLIERDVDEVAKRFGALLGRQPSVGERGEWRSLAWMSANS
jgi:ribosomal protein L11 methyltransferase